VARIHHSPKALLLALSLGLGSAVSAASTVTPPAAVGEVSMVLGKAWLHSATGERHAIRVGTRISVSDSIETSRNGHVHVRFVDQGLVVVRPSSTLDVERYDYDVANPAASAVKLNLREGVARSISGAAAESAKQNFRLNTPLAAIGVRGTDFVVSASADSTRALVKQGAIVLAPFSSDCSAAALGPCSNNALELSGELNQIAVLHASSLQPALLPRPDTDIPEALLLPGSAPQLLAEQDAAVVESDKKDGGTDIYTDSVTSLAVNRKLSSGRQLAAIPKYTPDAAVPAEQLTRNTQLVWGRWFERRLDNERITVPYSVAVSDGREASVGSDSYALFRLEHGSKDLNIKPGLGVVAFNLNQAQAILNTGSARELMDIYGGLLNINFDARQFSTSLQLGHTATGRIEFRDAGRVFDGGTFRNRTDEQVTAGVLSIDGREAGYFFQTTVPAGAIEGITLWGVKP
jgi:hypothetical protein